MGVVRDPPHVAVGPARQQLVAGLGKGRRIAAPADIVHGGCGNDLLAVELAPVAQHLAKARQVPQAQVQAAACKGRARGVHRHVGILLGAQAAPDALGQQIGHRLAAHARQHPAQRIGVGRAVAEGLAVHAFGLHGLQEFVVAARPGVVLGLGQRVARCRVRPDLGLGVRIVFAEAYARGHVHELAHRGVAEGRDRQLGHVLRHAARGVELPLGSQHGRQRSDEGLGHRHGAVLAFGFEHAEVALIDHAALVQHHDAVGVVGLERIAPGHGLAGTQWREAQLVDVVAQRLGQRRCRRQAARHIHGGHELAKVRDAPAHGGKLEIGAVVEAQRAVRRRR